MAVVFKNIAFTGDVPTAHTLASHSTKAHSELSDAPEGAHHTKFTTTEHTAIGNGAPHHTKYTDSDALAVAISKTLMTTRGDIIYRNATVPARLAKGSSGDVLTMGANDPAWAAPAAAGATLTVAQTEVFDGTGNTPTAWTDLDLSSVIGSNPALVYLTVVREANDSGYAAFRQNGATLSWTNAMVRSDITVADWVYTFMLPTDSGGIIEWDCFAAVLNVHVYVIAFIK